MDRDKLKKPLFCQSSLRSQMFSMRTDRVRVERETHVSSASATESIVLVRKGKRNGPFL